MIVAITGLMGAGLGLSIGGSLQVYQGKGTSSDLLHWKVGSGLVVAVWATEVVWAIFSLLPSQCKKDAPGFKDGTKVCILAWRELYSMSANICHFVSLCMVLSVLSSSPVFVLSTISSGFVHRERT